MAKRWMVALALCGCGSLIDAGVTHPVDDDATETDASAGSPGDAPADTATPWEDDTFDMSPGPLGGRNGWGIGDGRRDAIVVGGALRLDPHGGQINLSKAVSHQLAGRHRLSLVARFSDGPLLGDPSSVAKLEVGSNQGKLLQLFLGKVIRVLHPADLHLVEDAKLDHPYRIEIDLDLTASTFTIRVDDTVFPRLPLPGTSITGFALTGWDVPGAVTLDDLRGVPIP